MREKILLFVGRLVISTDRERRKIGYGLIGLSVAVFVLMYSYKEAVTSLPFVVVLFVSVVVGCIFGVGLLAVNSVPREYPYDYRYPSLFETMAQQVTVRRVDKVRANSAEFKQKYARFCEEHTWVSPTV